MFGRETVDSWSQESFSRGGIGTSSFTSPDSKMRGVSSTSSVSYSGSALLREVAVFSIVDI